MCKNDYEKVQVGNLVRVSPKHSSNFGRIGKVVYKRKNYVCVEPIEGEPDFSGGSRYAAGTQALMTYSYTYLELVE